MKGIGIGVGDLFSGASAIGAEALGGALRGHMGYSVVRNEAKIRPQTHLFGNLNSDEVDREHLTERLKRLRDDISRLHYQFSIEFDRFFAVGCSKLSGSDRAEFADPNSSIEFSYLYKKIGPQLLRVAPATAYC